MQLGARHRIQCAERLIHQQQRRIDGQRTRDTNALSLSPRQLVGPAIGERVRSQSHQIEQLDRASMGSIIRPFFQTRNDRNVRSDRHMREETDVLKDVASTPTQTDRIPVARVALFDVNSTGLRHQQTVDELQQRAFAGAAAANERDDFASPDGERETVEDPHATARERYVAELERGIRHWLCDGTTVGLANQSRATQGGTDQWAT
ncbi:MAG TPA: hypothetical protein VKH42_20450 [Vicinamibacterales bacterium]|nr:hypothetical protein [Vicinamibacterales bacterium]